MKSQKSIIDNGLGIKPEFHKKVFEVFNTLHGRDEIESTGIGLSIVKRVIEDNNGEISIHSNSDCGCNFTFTWKK